MKTNSLKVVVVKRPQVEVEPLASTLRRGGSLLCTCFSRDDEMADFVYHWLRDGEGPIDPGPNQEVVEDLYPTGCRLTVQSAQVSAVYTCEVESPAGKVRETCRLTVTSGKLHFSCFFFLGGKKHKNFFLARLKERTVLRFGNDIRSIFTKQNGKDSGCFSRLNSHRLVETPMQSGGIFGGELDRHVRWWSECQSLHIRL